MEQISLGIEVPHVNRIRPVPKGSCGYVPILKSKAGEWDALAEWSLLVSATATPLIESVAKAGKTRGIAGLPAALSKYLQGQTFFLDFPFLDGSEPLLEGKNPVDFVLSACRSPRRRLQVIPVLASGTPANYAESIRAAVKADARGVCLRLKRSEFVGGSSNRVKAIIDRALKPFELKANGVDLLLDLEDVAASKIQAATLSRAINRLPNLQEWRSLILASSVIPATLQGVPTGGRITTKPRGDWALWRQTVASHDDLLRVPTYSDYGVQSPWPPAEADDIPPGLMLDLMRVNIRYTGTDQYLIARGGKVKEGPAMYVPLAKALRDHEEFKGRDYSAGDACIADVAEGRQLPGRQRMWRFAGTSHHMELVSRQLADWCQKRGGAGR